MQELTLPVTSTKKLPVPEKNEIGKILSWVPLWQKSFYFRCFSTKYWNRRCSRAWCERWQSWKYRNSYVRNDERRKCVEFQF
jgi:hypothetical protein